MTLSIPFINYTTSNSKLMNITPEKDMADIGHGLVSSVILTYAWRERDREQKTKQNTS